MSGRSLALLTVLAAGTVVILRVQISAASQAPTAQAKSQTLAPVKETTRRPPRTPWGEPDLQGVWDNATSTPLASSAGDASVFTEDEDIRAQGEDAGTYNNFWVDRGKGTDRKFLLVDPPGGKIPPLTPEAKQREAARLEARRRRGDADSYLDRNRWERCLTRGLPMVPGPYNNTYQILQTPGYVVIVMEILHDTRIIPLDGRPHSSSDIRTWLGDSRGHWEGDTLVVDTINFNDKLDGGLYMPSHRGAMFTHRGSGETLHLIERFTRVDAKTINYEFTMDDPKTYTKPWTVLVPMVKTDDQLYEYACHEGNYALVDILRGARVEEKKAAEDAAGKNVEAK